MDGVLTLARLKKHLHGLETAELGEVILRLFGASSDNKRLLTALLEGNVDGLREQVVREIGKAFGVHSRFHTLKTAGLRTALPAVRQGRAAGSVAACRAGRGRGGNSLRRRVR